MDVGSKGGAAALILLLAAFGNPARSQEAYWPDLSPPTKAAGGGEKDAAVIVGAEAYLAAENVPGALRNAEDWRAYLTDSLKVPSDRVLVLRNEEATLEAMRGAAAKAASEVQRGGTLWFVFIGHGFPSPDGKDGLLVGVDAQQSADSLSARSLSRSELLGLLDKGGQTETVVLIDAGFSGKTSSGRDLVEGLAPAANVPSAPPDVDKRTILLTAAKSGQLAGPLPNAAQLRPAFSYLVLGALRGWAADSSGRVTAGAAVRFARKALSPAGAGQTPELAAGSTDVVLGRGRERAPDVGAPAPPATEAPKPAVVDAGIEWVRIPGGRFTMGKDADGLSFRDAHPPHRVKVKSFQMAKTLVTNKQYRACVTAGACTPPTSYGPRSEGDDQPIVGVDWSQATAFSKWAGGRLPTEAEWEYAARSGGRDQKYPWGDEAASCALAVLSGCGDGTAPVCSKPAGNTRQGLCDMTGDAWEWTEDSYHGSYDGAPADGSAWGNAADSARVIRGGTWRRGTGESALRNHFDANYRFGLLSFRPVRSL